jgi:general secretion pathway protein N
VGWLNRRPARIASIRSRAFLGLTLIAAGCAVSQFPALAAAGRGDAGAQPQIARPLAATPSAQSIKTGNPLWAIPLRFMSATRQRPLFSPSRRPPAPPVAAALPPPPPPSKPAPPAPPPLTLVGTVLGEGGSIGIFVDQGTKDIIRLRIGEGHAGWTLHAVESRTATLEQDQRKAIIALSPRDGTVQEAASSPQSDGGVPPSPSPPQLAQQGPATVAPPGKWIDGDGQVINPPALKAKMTAQSSPMNSWVDGDGQLIGPPRRQGGQSAQP